MNEKRRQLVFIVLAFSIVLSLFSGCVEEDEEEILDIGADADPAIIASLPFQERSFLMGTAGYVPNHFPNSSPADWQSFFDRGAAEYGGLFGVHVSHETEKDENDILVQIRMAYEGVRYVTPYVELAYDHKEGEFTNETGEALVRVAKANAEKYNPVYFSIGVEINSNYVHQPESYDLYVHYAREALEEIKRVSPNTIRMTNFQLESMKGENQLTGQSHPAHWHLIDDFSGTIEALSFTVYPFLHYTSVEMIPNNYLNEIRNYSDLPILITETGWPTVELITGVKGSHQDQIDYMVKISNQANDLDVQALIWVLPRDGEFGVAGGVFDNVSLFTNEGNPKPAYAYWKAIYAVPYS